MFSGLRCAFCGTSIEDGRIFWSDGGKLICSNCELRWDGVDHMRDNHYHIEKIDELKEELKEEICKNTKTIVAGVRKSNRKLIIEDQTYPVDIVFDEDESGCITIDAKGRLTGEVQSSVKVSKKDLEMMVGILCGTR